jgi:hypothetical protein
MPAAPAGACWGRVPVDGPRRQTAVAVTSPLNPCPLAEPRRHGVPRRSRRAAAGTSRASSGRKAASHGLPRGKGSPTMVMPDEQAPVVSPVRSPAFQNETTVVPLDCRSPDPTSLARGRLIESFSCSGPPATDAIRGDCRLGPTVRLVTRYALRSPQCRTLALHGSGMARRAPLARWQRFRRGRASSHRRTRASSQRPVHPGNVGPPALRADHYVS